MYMYYIYELYICNILMHFVGFSIFRRKIFQLVIEVLHCQLQFYHFRDWGHYPWYAIFVCQFVDTVGKVVSGLNNSNFIFNVQVVCSLLGFELLFLFDLASGVLIGQLECDSMKSRQRQTLALKNKDIRHLAVYIFFIIHVNNKVICLLNYIFEI